MKAFGDLNKLIANIKKTRLNFLWMGGKQCYAVYSSSDDRVRLTYRCTIHKAFKV